jgi:hypothetical protein
MANLLAYMQEPGKKPKFEGGMVGDADNLTPA